MEWYSVRMRAAEGGAHEHGGTHISGGERLVRPEEVEATVLSLVRRAMTHEKGEPDFINLTVERVADHEVQRIPCLPMSTREVSSVPEGHEVAVQLLVAADVREEVARRAVQLLVAGPAPGSGVMRGAVVMDADTGERLEADPARGVRVTRIDWEPGAREIWKGRAGALASERIAEAVALASKVAACPGTVAELCWSDDPSYVTGYVAAPALGYVRITRLKPLGSPLGGRVFFVRNLPSFQEYERALQAPVMLMEPERGMIFR
jgi:6-carboxyhexanoate--CoA ligase